MQYISALALSNLSGKAPSTNDLTQQKSPLSPSLRLLVSPSMRNKLIMS